MRQRVLAGASSDKLVPGHRRKRENSHSTDLNVEAVVEVVHGLSVVLGFYADLAQLLVHLRQLQVRRLVLRLSVCGENIS